MPDGFTGFGKIYAAGQITSGVGFVPPSYAVADLPSAASYDGVVIYCSDGNAGSPCLARSDGSDWICMATGVAVAASGS